MTIVGSILASDAQMMGAFFFILGMVMMSLGTIMAESRFVQVENKKSLKERITSFLISLYQLVLPGLFFPILLPLSPLIFVVLKGWALFMANSRLLKAQSTLGGRGESLFEAVPQFALQLYIILLTMTPPGWIKLFSIITSALTLSLKNIEQYVNECLEVLYAIT